MLSGPWQTGVIGQRALLTATVIHVTGTGIIAWTTGTGFDSVVLDPTALPPALAVVACVALVAGMGLAMILPGLAFTSDQSSLSARLPQAVLLTILLLSVVLAIPKVFGVTLTRTMLVMACGFLWIMALQRRPSRSGASSPDVGTDMIVGVVLVVALTLLLWPKLFIEDFAGDGIEHFEYARSLKTALLPHWDLENGHWGFHHRFVAFAYISLPTVLMVGETEAAVRLPAIMVAGLLVPLAGRLYLDLAGLRRAIVSTVIACHILVLLTLNAYYATWDPRIADIAEPTTTDLYATYLVASAAIHLLAGSFAWGIVASLLATITVQIGVPLVAALLVLLAAADIKRYARVVGAIAGCYLVIVATYGIYAADMSGARTIYDVNYLLRYWQVAPDPTGVLVTGTLLVASTCLSALIVPPLLARNDRDGNILYLGALFVAIAFVLSARINPHYFLAPATLMLLSLGRKIGLSTRPEVWAIPLACPALAIFLWLVPWDYEPIRDSSRLASMIHVDGESYKERVAIAAHVYDVFPFNEYGLGHHTLVHYTGRTPCDSCEYVLTREDGHVGFDILSERDGVRVLRREGAASTAPVVTRPSSCPGLLRRLYSTHRRAVQDDLRGPARLPWSICLE